MRELLTVVVFEMFIVMVAMGWDFASGYYKAKLRARSVIRMACVGRSVSSYFTLVAYV